ncbi:Alpha/Beta hydrolase protein [Polychytrium aggregatum]|uniref:Alpha/Beta hydrolase protein n=1 Tax=Polychytrium aggregatum TaxID=110093 RepID=UPI0022FE7504|nr:Alpha/Beta hydrolase protein [Polychytrium aggregatum]KAI9206525.1 Alpha/Beta hydrolase protein [Polychytrium aggregatum]
MFSPSKLAAIWATLALALVSAALGRTLKWTSCPGLDEPYACSSLVVPLDHLDPGFETISIGLIRYRPSISNGSMGSILINPGGPGGSGVEVVKVAGSILATITGGGYDIVGFDPRGIGESQSVLCNPSVDAHTTFDAIELELALNIPGINPAWASFQKTKALACGRYSSGYLPFLSTAYVARDMDLIREALGESVLNFFGFSYGTFLGLTYINMFPDRVGRVVIDGVVNPDMYTATPIDMWSGSLVDILPEFEEFGRQCQQAGPTGCALSRPEGSGRDVTARIRSLINELDADPISFVDSGIPTVISGRFVGQIVFQVMYSTTAWPALAAALQDIIESRNATAIARMSGITSEKQLCQTKDVSGNNGFPSVFCLDGHGSDKLSLQHWIDADIDMNSKYSFLGTGLLLRSLSCKYWPVKAAERYTGPWDRKLKNKVLIIGSTYDPVTPLASARHVEKLMRGNGVLLHHDGAGHTSLGQFSLCTMGKLWSYFYFGILPERGTKCPITVPAFPPPDAPSMLVQSEEMLSQLDQAWAGQLKLEDIEVLQTQIALVNTKHLLGH